MKQRKIFVFLTSLLAVSYIFGQANQTTTPAPTEPSAPPVKVERKKDYIREAEKKWLNPDYRPYIKSFEELNKLSDAFAKNKVRLALSNYQTGRSIMQKMREDVQRFIEDTSESKKLSEKWYWQTIDRKAREERVISKKKQGAKLKAVTYYSRAINHLDSIQSKRIRESVEYKLLLADVYREWCVQQYDLGNIPQIIDILERYIKLDPKYEAEIPPHRYLASAYGFKEKILLKYDAGTQQERTFYKKKKNTHLLRAAELKYQKGSPEYDQILELVNRDEVIAVTN